MSSYTERLIKAIGEVEMIDDKMLGSIEERVRRFNKEERERKELEHKQNGGRMTWGRHKHKCLTDIAAFDPGYITWLKRNDSYLSNVQRDILKSL
jgi:hypothetical protein